jgi:hypothetical protein
LARIRRNVMRWQVGEMRLRWTAAGMLDSQRQFRRIIGHRDLAKLVGAVEREVNAAPLPRPTNATRKEAPEIVTV